MKNNKIILKEGFVPIGISLAIGLFLTIFISDFLANIAFIFSFILAIIYRNPNRSVYNIDEKDIIAPIDGKVSAIDIGKHNYKIYIDVNLCNTHILRAPIKGKFKIKDFKYGLNLNSSTYKAKLLNSQAVLKFNNIKLKLISGICNSNITLYKEGNISSTQEIGIFLNGVVIVDIPKEYKLNVNINDKVYSGMTKLA